MKVLILKNLELYIKNENWPSSMHNLIGNEYEVFSETHDHDLNTKVYYISDIKNKSMWLIPTDCSEIIKDDDIKIKWYNSGRN